MPFPAMISLLFLSVFLYLTMFFPLHVSCVRIFHLFFWLIFSLVADVFFIFIYLCCSICPSICLSLSLNLHVFCKADAPKQPSTNKWDVNNNVWISSNSNQFRCTLSINKAETVLITKGLAFWLAYKTILSSSLLKRRSTIVKQGFIFSL